MIKRTLYFGSPTYLSLKKEQLVIQLPEVVKNDSLPDTFKSEAVRTIPIEDIGIVILDNKQITITHGVIESLLANNCALITCNSNRMPVGLMLPLDGNTTQTERFRNQIDASIPLKKQLWQQTIQAKIENQAYVLAKNTDCIVKNMQVWAADVKSGDPDNYEARAAVYYWANIFPQIKDFTRNREGVPPNNLLNYGYAILRAIVARALVASGLLHIRYTPQEQIQRLLPCRRYYGTLPPICRYGSLRHCYQCISLRRTDTGNKDKTPQDTCFRRYYRWRTKSSNDCRRTNNRLALQMFLGRVSKDKIPFICIIFCCGAF